MDKPLRRIVTGHDSRGKAVVTSDGPPPVAHRFANTGHTLTDFWVTYASPTPIEQPGDPTLGRSGVVLAPPPGGTVVRIVDLPPDKSWIGRFDDQAAKAAFTDIGAREAHVEMTKPPHPLMHRTKTVDYGIVLEGEIWLVLDDSETLVRAGEMVIQRGTNHAWANRSDKPCRIAFILVDGAWTDSAPADARRT